MMICLNNYPFWTSASKGQKLILFFTQIKYPLSFRTKPDFVVAQQHDLNSTEFKLNINNNCRSKTIILKKKKTIEVKEICTYICYLEDARAISYFY